MIDVLRMGYASMQPGDQTPQVAQCNSCFVKGKSTSSIDGQTFFYG